jgi:hypothetical protein
MKEDNWNIVKDAVDYPVEIRPAYWIEDDGLAHRADGYSETGRENEYNLVVVDRDKTGDKKVIACVNGVYGTLNTVSVYNDLQQQLAEMGIEYDLQSHYVSGNGGSHQLKLIIGGLQSIDGLPDAAQMEVTLETSVDSSKSHGLVARAWDAKNGYSVEVYGGHYKLKARHTKTIADRTVDFIPFLRNMITNWNEVIIPTMILMYDHKFDRTMAVQLIEDIAKEAGLAEKHTQNIKSLYQADMIKTEAVGDSMYKVNAAFGQYISQELEENSRALSDKTREKIASSIYDRLKDKK